MTDYREIAKEARRRADEIKARDRRIKKAAMLCLPVLLCISVLSATLIPRRFGVSMPLYTEMNASGGIASEMSDSGGGTADTASRLDFVQLYGDEHMLAAPKYPERVKYPVLKDYFSDGSNGESSDYNAAFEAWLSDLPQQTRCTVSAGGFFAASARRLLCGAGQSNRVYSPLNIFMALGMLAEISGGDSRRQILDALGVNSMEQLRAEASAVWNADYKDDGVTVSRLASSIWLRDDMNYNRDTLNSLAADYYASSFSGKMGDEEYNSVFRKWLDEQTNGFLSDYTAGAGLDADAVMALAQTVFYKADWSDRFEETNTTEGVFHGADGDTPCKFMRDSIVGDYYYGKSFGAVMSPLSDGGKMWFILPNEGSSTDEVMQSDAMAAFFAGEQWANSRCVTIHRSILKFDASSEIDLINELRSLGITDIFDKTAADLSPVTLDKNDLFVGDVQHCARVTINENGLTGAASATAKAFPYSYTQGDGEIDFILDRPFIFVVADASDLPLFAGVINCAG